MSRNLSDYNDSRATVVARKNLYSDIDNSFNVHPIYNDILPIVDIDSIKQSLKNLLLTNQYDRCFQPNIYSDVSALLFENADIFSELELKEKIENVIDIYEPRISNYEVTVSDDSDRNAYKVFIKFETSYDSSSEITIYLTRIR
jgi:phage baseplate assembly protein W